MINLLIGIGIGLIFGGLIGAIVMICLIGGDE